MDQVRDDFGVGLAGEDMAGLGQLGSQRLEIFDNAIMNDSHSP